MKRRYLIRIISYVAAAFAISVGWTVYYSNIADGYKTKLEYTYQRSLAELDDYINEIDSSLEKSIYAGSEKQFSSLATQMWRDTSCAKMSLSSLPACGSNLDNVNKFLTQVGDYALTLSEKSGKDTDITQDEIDKLIELRSYASKLKDAVAQISVGIQQGESWNEAYVAISDKDIVPTSQTSFSELEENFTNYPMLIYDGPFSDEEYTETSSAIKGHSEISIEEARKKAAAFTGVKEEDFSECREEKGELPCYSISSEDFSVDVTIHGGHIASMISSRAISEKTLTAQDAVKKAEAFLSEKSYPNMRVTGYETNFGVCTVSFAYVDSDIIVYPDIIKVGVAIDNGEILSFDATGFLRNHKDREYSAARHSLEEAKAIVSKQLSINRQTLTVIPDNTGKELLCYEFKCTGINNETVLVYVNAIDLTEEKILIVIESDDSSLAV